MKSFWSSTVLQNLYREVKNKELKNLIPKFVGINITEDLSCFAVSNEYMDRPKIIKFSEELLKISQSYTPHAFVFGISLNELGKHTAKSREEFSFIAKIADRHDYKGDFYFWRKFERHDKMANSVKKNTCGMLEDFLHELKLQKIEN
ncbi:hypothetical protein MHBO_000467 [Bonamia ostreae]|uniref:Uncharacterized protein n=1 Tax=Bonamia ostreae TaxID=126728 RepID=A0ABV2AGI7_9EUKA